MDDDSSRIDRLRTLIAVLLIFAVGMMAGRVLGRIMFQTL